MGARWPAEWFKVYNEGQYVHADPVIRHLRRSVKPFEWTEACYDAETEPKAAELMRLRADFGFGRVRGADSETGRQHGRRIHKRA